MNIRLGKVLILLNINSEDTGWDFLSIGDRIRRNVFSCLAAISIAPYMSFDVELQKRELCRKDKRDSLYVR